MREVDYNIIAFDAQYFLVKNFSALKSRSYHEEVRFLDPSEGDNSIGHIICIYDFDYQDLVKQFFWTIAKEIREWFTCHKVLLLWDYPKYHKTELLPDYKSNRVHICKEALDDINAESDPEAYLQMKEDIRIEDIKNQAKWWIINNLNSFGMISVIHKGYEADDLACIFSRDTFGSMGPVGKNAICSIDNDWLYWITEDVDFIKAPKNSSGDYEVWTYQDAVDECEGMTDKLGIDIFTLKMYMDSTFYSHNDLMKTSTLGWKDFEQLYNEIQNKDYSHITDVDRLNKNLKSFEIWNYPDFELVCLEVSTAIAKGKLGTIITYADLKSKGFKVSQKYAENYLTTLSSEYYEPESQEETKLSETGSTEES